MTNSRDGCQNCILHSIGTFHWRKLIFGKFHCLFNQFWTLNWHFLDFWQKQLNRVAKFVLEERKGTFWEKKCHEADIIFVFFGLWAKNGRILAKKFSCIPQTADYVSMGSFTEVFFSFDNLFCRNRTFRKKFWKLCQNCWIWAQKIVLREKKLQKFCFFFIIFRFGAQTFYFR